MNTLAPEKLAKAIQELLSRQLPVIRNYCSSGAYEKDIVLNLLTTLKAESMEIIAIGLLRVNDALELIKAMDEADLSDEQKGALYSKITLAREAPTWGEMARVLLVWENGMAFTQMPLSLMTSFAMLPGKN